MAEVKWIKIVTDIFDDEKMLFIEQLPEADSIIVIWFKLLVLAGKINNGGVLLFRDSIPYTDEMLSTIFRRPINTVRLALKTFEDFGMVEIVNNAITIPNWGKHQSLDQLESRKEYMKEYMRGYREKQKQLAEGKVNSKVNSKANVNSLDIEEERDKDIYSGRKEVFKHYLSLNLIKHKKYTPAMDLAIKTAMKNNGYTIEDCKTLLDRHKQTVETTKGSQYPVRARPLHEFFGQKAYQAKHLICAEYEEGGKYYNTTPKREEPQPSYFKPLKYEYED